MREIRKVAILEFVEWECRALQLIIERYEKHEYEDISDRDRNELSMKFYRAESLLQKENLVNI